ncbi:MAG TPA: Asp23/Gls24 family envelope stress response protein [Oscillospiraceae bacterium]|nr:Asp23/Gls24 family envelope stress response protein [Oscillospiraceae bacterium]
MDALGKTTVSEDVFQSIAEIALKDIEDIVTKEKKGPFAGISRIFAERFSPQVTVKRDENAEGEFGQVGYELRLAVMYGVKIPEAALKVRSSVIKTVENLTGYKVTKVDIVVDRIVEIKELEADIDQAKETRE